MACGGSDGDWGSSRDGVLTTAIPEVVATIMPHESEWDEQKLEKKLREYFSKAAKHLQFRGKSLPSLVNEYADNVMGSIFAGLGDREWLLTGQADFLLCVDAGIKDHFPSYMLRGVSQLDFEQLVLAAYDRAFDEQRFWPILSEQVPNFVSGPKIKKKVWNSVDFGRKDAVASGITTVDEFTQHWINRAVAQLSQSSYGSAEATIPMDACIKLFTALLEGGALPLSLTQEGAVAAPVHLVEEAVTAAYAEHSQPEEEWEPAKKKAKKASGGQFSAW